LCMFFMFCFFLFFWVCSLSRARFFFIPIQIEFVFFSLSLLFTLPLNRRSWTSFVSKRDSRFFVFVEVRCGPLAFFFVPFFFVLFKRIPLKKKKIQHPRGCKKTVLFCCSSTPNVVLLCPRFIEFFCTRAYVYLCGFRDFFIYFLFFRLLVPPSSRILLARIPITSWNFFFSVGGVVFASVSFLRIISWLLFCFFLRPSSFFYRYFPYTCFVWIAQPRPPRSRLRPASPRRPPLSQLRSLALSLAFYFIYSYFLFLILFVSYDVLFVSCCYNTRIIAKTGRRQRRKLEQAS